MKLRPHIHNLAPNVDPSTHSGTYPSWLNQVELWFAKIEREVIAPGVFSSVPDLARKLRRYSYAHSANARPTHWKYSDPARRIRTNELPATRH